VVTGVALYAVGAPKISTAVSECNGGRAKCAADVAQLGNTGRGLETAGGVVGGIGVAAAAAGLIWYFKSPRSTPSTAGAPLIPVVAPGYVGIAMSGSL
jgi:hypothetical protein